MHHSHSTMHRIAATRELCHALKEHVGRVEELLAQGETDRTTLFEINRQRVNEYQVNKWTNMLVIMMTS